MAQGKAYTQVKKKKKKRRKRIRKDQEKQQETDVETFENYYSHSQGKSAILNRAALWPNGVIPFMIDPSLRSVEYIVRQAIEQYHYYTCIRFIPRTNQQNYLRIFNGGGCYAHVGVTSGEQPVSLGRGCHNVGTAVHELGHSIGFYHEQNRSDRDEFLQIHWENIAL
ncbi:astacin-like metalloprotease toxin 1, partial [Ctenocephalides felis]|uniref:astacin-like metalloprotease toxin 1 n=1 Tax=Ctenocephalides felis TaxID=7515 RepID=UPI000E6E3D1C